MGKDIYKDIYKAFGVTELGSATGAGEPIALNTLPWHRKEIVELSETQLGVACGSGLLVNVQPFKTRTAKAVTVQEVRDGVFVMQNDQLTVQVEDGNVTSLVDRKTGREIIPKGEKANQLVIFDDKPLYWQAWDVEVYHLDTRKVVPYGKTTILEDKEHRVSVLTEAIISDNSRIQTILSLSAAIKGRRSYVECTANVDWYETMQFLKVEFPVDIRNTEASYETQYGIVKRPTHYNTTWDMAKFEVCCHKFADLSEHGYGVSILNDSKYGFATCGNLMRLSLLRSPKAPDAHADMGKHTIRWAILPHQGELSPTTVRAGYYFNHRMKILQAPKTLDISTLMTNPVELKGDNSLILDCVKRGEDDEDVSYDSSIPPRKGRSVIIRIYESLGGRSTGTITTTWNVKKVFKTNILEDDGEEIKIDKDGAFSITVKPFEVATYRLQL